MDDEAAPGGDESPVLEPADGPEDERGFGGVAAGLDEPACGLDHRFEHHDAGEDGEACEVIAEVFLGTRDMLDGGDGGLCLVEDGVDEVEVHD